MAAESLELLRKVLKPSQGLVVKSPSNGGNLLKLWQDKSNLCYRVLTPKNESSYTQGDLKEVPLASIGSVLPSGDTAPFELTLRTDTGETLTLETASLEELSLLVVGFQGLVKEPAPPFQAVLGGAPGAGELDDANEAGAPPKAKEEDIVMLPAPNNASRLVCWTVVTHRHFDNLILLCIAVNCFFMAVEDPVKVKGSHGDKDQGAILYFDIDYAVALMVGTVLLWIFTIEAMLKNVAFTPWGYFFGPDANWNRLDFFIVLVGWLEEYPDYLGAMPFNLSFLRIFRVFRPLRTLGKMEGMKALISTMFLCFDPLVDVMNLTIFIFFVFSVLGMELFRGQGSQRCVDDSKWDEKRQEGTWAVLPDEYTFPIEERRCGGDFSCPEYDGVKYKCMNAGENPAEGIYKQNQADGIIGYDNLGQAMLTVFVFCTLEGWVDGMYQFQDSFQWAVSSIYHVLMIMLGTMFCMNLALAVIADTFEDAAGADDDEVEEGKGGDGGGEGEEEQQSGSTETAEAPSASTAASEDGAQSMIDSETGEARAPKPADKVSGLLWDLSYWPYFSNFIVFLIVLNTATLAMEHSTIECLKLVDIDYDAGSAESGYFTGEKPKCINQANLMSDDVENFLVASNFFFVAAFAFEMVVKLIGLRPEHYFKDSFNCFDFAIVIVSFVEISSDMKGLTALRCFRLARLFKMAKSWGSLRAIIESLLAVLPAMTSLSIMLLLYMFIAAVAGMQMLGNYIGYEERSRFTDFGVAMLTIFQMLTGENWNEVMFSAITSTGGYAIVVYFVLVVLIGNFLVLNLFLAIMLSDFNCGDPPDFSFGNMVNTFCPFLVKRKEEVEGKTVDDIDAAMTNEGKEDEDQFFSPAQLAKLDSEGGGSEDEVKKRRDLQRSKSSQRKLDFEQRNKKGSMEMVAIQSDMAAERKEKAKKVRNTLVGKSLGVFEVDDPFRRKCMRVARHPKFEAFILASIIISSIMLAAQGPTVNSSLPVWTALGYVDFLFILIFTVECALKIFVQGFLFCPDAYLKDPWNVLDFVVVLVGWIAADYPFFTSAGSGSGLGALRTLRSARALRPLRTIQRMPGMRLVVNVLFDCAPVFINICFVVLFFFTVFAIIGVQFFAGMFWSCNDGGVGVVDECWGCFEDADFTNPNDKCPVGFSQREWRNQKMNFDNVMNALLTLYEVAGLEMWLDVMYAAMDTIPDFSRHAHGEAEFPFGAQPKQEANWPAAFFFIVFILIGVFIVLNLFVGAVVDKFNELKSQGGGRNPLQTEEQAQYSESMALMARMRPFQVPLPPRKPRKKRGEENFGFTLKVYEARMKAYSVVMWDTSGKNMGTTFDMVVSFMVMLNIVVMGMYYWRRLPEGDLYDPTGQPLQDYQGTQYYQGLEFVNTIFTFLFLVEMLLKITAWGFKQYIRDMWNQLDFVLVVLSVIGFFVEQLLTSGSIPLNPAVFRIVRVARLTRALKSIRMVGRIKGIANLVDTLVLAIPAMSNVASLCFLMIFIFTVVGMDFYGFDDIDQEYVNGMYNRHANFRYFGDGFMLLFRTVTGEAWNGIMHDMMVAKCDPRLSPIKVTHKDYEEDYCGAPHETAWVFFVVFNVFVTGLLFELITAIVLDEFGKMGEADKLPVNADMISNFNDHWAQLDPEATQMIPQYKLLPFLKSIDPPVFESAREASTEIFKMNITSTAGKDGTLMVHYVDTLLAVVRYQYVKTCGEEVGSDLDLTMVESPELTNRIVSAYPHLKEIEKMEPKDFKQELAATKLQSAFKKKQAKFAIKQQRKHMESQVALINGSKDADIPDHIKQMSSSQLMGVIRKANEGNGEVL